MTTEGSRHLAASPGSPGNGAILLRIRALLGRHEVDPATAQPAPGRPTTKSKPMPPPAHQAGISHHRQVLIR
jgi:hypothetical protein